MPAEQLMPLPTAPAGPNNQKRDLRWAAALAHQMNCGLVLTGIFKHYLVRPSAC